MDVTILVDLLVYCLVGGLIYWIVLQFPLPAPFKTIAVVIVLLIFLIVLISFLSPGFIHLGPRLR